MAETIDDIMHPNLSHKDPQFPHAPEGWSRQDGEQAAREENISLTDDHWEVVRALQGYFARHEGERIKAREVHDALEEKFHGKGGVKYLYELFPGGPVAQGCRLAGLEVPPGATDKGFGSVV